MILFFCPFLKCKEKNHIYNGENLKKQIAVLDVAFIVYLQNK